MSDDMDDYLQTFLDETEEQLDDLVETMLVLETDSTNREELNEAFRLIHSIKGAAGMMGLNHITVLTHHLENRFERLRSGTELIDDATMNLVLRCIDFLRDCGARLRAGDQMGSPVELLEELKQIELRVAGDTRSGQSRDANQAVAAAADVSDAPTRSLIPMTSRDPESPDIDSCIQIVVRFRADLQLVDLKARLIVNRLSGLGTLLSTVPDLDSMPQDESIEAFEIRLETEVEFDRLRAAADVDGVESIDIRSPGPSVEAGAGVDMTWQRDTTEDGFENEQPLSDATDLEEASGRNANRWADEGEPIEGTMAAPIENQTPTSSGQSAQSFEPSIELDSDAWEDPSAVAQSPPPTATTVSQKKVAQTMRVDIDRLDDLMNLAGELVVNRARFEQISSQIGPTRGHANSVNRIRDFCDNLRDTIDALEQNSGGPGDRTALVRQLRSGLELMDEQATNWEADCRHLEEFGEAIDQLARVSKKMQKGVLDTRMVPVGPLFNRFNRVVRDLSKERGKRVNLLTLGEKTELDKRMIDELGDPLVHLIRNSLDHGLESPEERRDSGKPEVGTIVLEARHSGNNVFVSVRDDGRGIEIGKIKAKLVSNGILSESAVSELSEDQTLEYIWHPGFSTASAITDISGRGVGMDVVLNRIRQLNGSVEVESFPQQGTQFTIRLPLTLAIINCLLVEVRGITFAIPVDDVREIVSVGAKELINVQGKETIDVRDEFIPLVGIDDIFQWHDLGEGHGDRVSHQVASTGNQETVDVVILRSGGKSMGLRVTELFGSQDIVIKSLSENFIDIRGLSGASILGDGRVCLMLDVSTAIRMATHGSVRGEEEEYAT